MRSLILCYEHTRYDTGGAITHYERVPPSSLLKNKKHKERSKINDDRKQQRQTLGLNLITETK